ncbi:MAG: hypothetical protein IPO69_22245 [Saprospiraceae bacterium]|nr:hypothetical protein [Saprospiraceae bacterium]
MYKVQGDMKGALMNWESSLKITEEIRKNNPDWARDLSIEYDKLGDIYESLGDSESAKSALTSYESSLKIREELRKRNPDSADYARDLSYRMIE